MRIALIANDYVQQFPLENYGGIETCVENLAQGLFDNKADFFVVCPKRKNKKEYPFEIYETEEEPTLLSNKNSSYYAYSVAKVLKNLKFDIIWSQSNWSIDPLLFLKKPIICTFHDSCEKQYGWMKDLNKVKYRFISNFQYNNWVKEEWEKEKSFMCYTGLADSEFKLNELKKDYFLWCAGLNWGLNAKGLDIFIKLSETFKDKNFIAYGIGNKQLEEYLMNKNKTNSNFLYKGKLNRGKDHELVFSNARAFFLPTRLPEAFGRTVIESFSKGTPVYGSNYGALNELIKDNINGFKFCLETLSFNLDHKFNYKKVFESSYIFNISQEIKTLLKESNNL